MALNASLVAPTRSPRIAYLPVAANDNAPPEPPPAVAQRMPRRAEAPGMGTVRIGGGYVVA